jgi:hypothetical protein
MAISTSSWLFAWIAHPNHVSGKIGFEEIAAAWIDLAKPCACHAAGHASGLTPLRFK